MLFRISHEASADLEVQIMQLNHCDGVLSNHLKYFIRAKNISAYSNLYVSRSALVKTHRFKNSAYYLLIIHILSFLQKTSSKEVSKNICNIAGTIQDVVKKSDNECVCKV